MKAAQTRLQSQQEELCNLLSRIETSSSVGHAALTSAVTQLSSTVANAQRPSPRLHAGDIPPADSEARHAAAVAMNTDEDEEAMVADARHPSDGAAASERRLPRSGASTAAYLAFVDDADAQLKALLEAESTRLAQTQIALSAQEAAALARLRAEHAAASAAVAQAEADVLQGGASDHLALLLSRQQAIARQMDEVRALYDSRRRSTETETNRRRLHATHAHEAMLRDRYEAEMQRTSEAEAAWAMEAPDLASSVRRRQSSSPDIVGTVTDTSRSQQSALRARLQSKSERIERHRATVSELMAEREKLTAQASALRDAEQQLIGLARSAVWVEHQSGAAKQPSVLGGGVNADDADAMAAAYESDFEEEEAEVESASELEAWTSKPMPARGGRTPSEASIEDDVASFHEQSSIADAIEDEVSDDIGPAAGSDAGSVATAPAVSDAVESGEPDSSIAAELSSFHAVDAEADSVAEVLSSFHAGASTGSEAEELSSFRASPSAVHASEGHHHSVGDDATEALSSFRGGGDLTEEEETLSPFRPGTELPTERSTSQAAPGARAERQRTQDAAAGTMSEEEESFKFAHGELSAGIDSEPDTTERELQEEVQRLRRAIEVRVQEAQSAAQLRRKRRKRTLRRERRRLEAELARLDATIARAQAAETASETDEASLPPRAAAVVDNDAAAGYSDDFEPEAPSEAEKKEVRQVGAEPEAASGYSDDFEEVEEDVETEAGASEIAVEGDIFRSMRAVEEAEPEAGALSHGDKSTDTSARLAARFSPPHGQSAPALSRTGDASPAASSPADSGQILTGSDIPGASDDDVDSEILYSPARRPRKEEGAEPATEAQAADGQDEAVPDKVAAVTDHLMRELVDEAIAEGVRARRASPARTVDPRPGVPSREGSVSPRSPTPSARELQRLAAQESAAQLSPSGASSSSNGSSSPTASGRSTACSPPREEVVERLAVEKAVPVAAGQAAHDTRRSESRLAAAGAAGVDAASQDARLIHSVLQVC
jgi:hypothetical protein